MRLLSRYKGICSTFMLSNNSWLIWHLGKCQTDSLCKRQQGEEAVLACLVWTAMWHGAESGIERTWVLGRLQGRAHVDACLSENWVHTGRPAALIWFREGWSTPRMSQSDFYCIVIVRTTGAKWRVKARIDLQTLSTFNLFYCVSTTANVIQVSGWASCILQACWDQDIYTQRSTE